MLLIAPQLLFMAWTLKPQAADAPPYRQPQLAAAYGRVAMAFGAGPSIYFASSPDHGASFGAPVKVADTGALALGRHRGPRLTILKDSMLITAVSGEKVATGPHAHGLPDNGNLTVWRSVDQGKTWSRTGVINDVPGAAREGLHAIAASPDGRKLFAAWLDLREKGTQLWGAESTDGGRTWSKNSAIYASPDGTICQCCHPSLTIDAKGGIWLMWRNVIDGSRDMHLLHASDGKRFQSPAQKLGEGSWKINACPMDGGGFLVAEDGKVTSAWRRESEIILAEAGKPERSLGPGKDVAIARGAGGLYLAFTRDNAIWIHDAASGGLRQVGPEGGFATLLPLEDGSMLAAWEARGAIETLRLPAGREKH